MKIKSFVFNPFGVNTYVLHDDSANCVIIDAACYEKSEVSELEDFISANRLSPVALLATHGHVDHICGNGFIMNTYKIPFLMNQKDLYFVQTAVEYGKMFGFDIVQPAYPTGYLEKEDFRFGNSTLKVIPAPGHSEGSVMFYSEADGILVTGDVLFSGSIGRTDLEGGDYDTLMNSIRNRILGLPAGTMVFPGHGVATTIERELKYNPFLTGSY